MRSAPPAAPKPCAACSIIPPLTRVASPTLAASALTAHARHYALRAPRRFVGDRCDPRLTLDIFRVVVTAHAILIDTS